MENLEYAAKAYKQVDFIFEMKRSAGFFADIIADAIARSAGRSSNEMSMEVLKSLHHYGVCLIDMKSLGLYDQFKHEHLPVLVDISDDALLVAPGKVGV